MSMVGGIIQMVSWIGHIQDMDTMNMGVGGIRMEDLLVLRK